MPIIRFRRNAPNPAGDAPATGFFRFSLTKPHATVGDPDTVVTVKPFKVPLVAGGVDVDLAPTPAGFAWTVLESVDGVRDETYYVTVPDVPGPLDDPDLARVDPGTLSPRAVPEAAWWPVANATITSAAVVGNDLVLTRHDGSTVNAGPVIGPQGVQGVQGVKGDTGATGPQGPGPTPEQLAAAAASVIPAGAMYVFADTDGRPYFT